MKKSILLFLLPGVVHLLPAQHTNVLIGDQFNPNEPSICINPAHPEQLVAGANLNNVYYSADTGHTWVAQKLSSSFGVWGDPTVSIDQNNAFVFLHLSNPTFGNWIDRIVCQKSKDGGKTWSDGTFAGLNGTKNQDKQWIAVNPTNNDYYVTWTEFDAYNSNNPADSSRILFSKSTDAGLTWTVPKRLNRISGDCLDSDNTVEGAVPCLGPNGEIYVVWAGPAGLVFDRSLDNGETWLDQDIAIGPFPGGWDYAIPGFQRCNGLPALVCDRSNGPNRGTIYVNWTDQRNGADDTDVWLAESTDGGQHWSAPVRVNDDAPGNQQFLTWMAIDQETGWLWFVFYDRRQLAGSLTNVYMAVSRDGGATFRNFLVSESPFTASTGQFMGDYIHLTVHENIVRPIWTRMSGNSTSVWTTLVDVSKTTATAVPEESGMDLQQNYPNPANADTWIPFKIRHRMAVTLQIIGENGQVLHTVFENKIYEYGKYAERIPIQELGLPAGNYSVVLSAEGRILNKRLIVVGQ